MRAELEQIKKVEDYLLGNLTKEEKFQFEEYAKNNLEFAQEIEWQKIVMDRISKIAIKNEIAAAHTRYMKRFRFSLKNKLFRNYLLSTAIILSLVISGVVLINNKMKTDAQSSDSSHSYYQSDINPKEGAVLKFSKDNYIIIPPDALIDKRGVSVNKPVTIKYRQFSSKKTSVTSKSNIGNLIEIKAIHNNKPTKLKEGKTIEIIYKPFNNKEAIENYQDANETKAYTIELSGQVVNGKLLPKLMQDIHIENPEGDSVAIRKRNLLITALNVLDSINSNYSKTTSDNYEEAELNELIRKRLIVLCNSQNQDVIAKLNKINTDKESLISNSSLIENLYKNYEDKFINELNLNFRFHSTIKIKQLGIWLIK